MSIFWFGIYFVFKAPTNFIFLFNCLFNLLKSILHATVRCCAKICFPMSEPKKKNTILFFPIHLSINFLRIIKIFCKNENKFRIFKKIKYRLSSITSYHIINKRGNSVYIHMPQCLLTVANQLNLKIYLRIYVENLITVYINRINSLTPIPFIFRFF